MGKCNAIVLSLIGSTVSVELIPSIVYCLTDRKVREEFKERFIQLNLTRICHLWSEMANLKMGTNSMTCYFSRMKDLWNELDVMISMPSCGCKKCSIYVEHLKSQQLL